MPKLRWKRMNDLFAPVGSLGTEEIIDKLLAASGPDTLAGRYRTLREMYAEAQERLAMAVEAANVYLKEETSMCTSPGERAVRDAIDATAPAVAEFVQKVERRGAAKELRRVLGSDARVMREHDELIGYVLACDLEARADELEGA